MDGEAPTTHQCRTCRWWGSEEGFFFLPNHRDWRPCLRVYEDDAQMGVATYGDFCFVTPEHFGCSEWSPNDPDAPDTEED